MSINRQHSFWGSLSPLGGLTGAGILVIASARLSWSITIAGCLFWVYGFTSFSFAFLSSLVKDKFFPSCGRSAVYVCLASFWACLYIFIFWLLSPFAALEVFLLMLLVPLFCVSANISDINNQESIDVSEHVSGAVSKAAVLSCLVILISIVREPLSYGSLSFPGTHNGLVTIMYFNKNAFFPIELFATSAGALLMLGYIICLYHYTRSFIFPGDRL